MARQLLGACMLLAAFLLVAAASAAARADDDDPSGGTGIRQPDSAYRGRKVGGRTEVRDVEGDEEVQRLGRFSVAEYNRQQQQLGGGGGGSVLEFARVVSAQRQVVSGLMYYLRVAAVEEGGSENGERVFDAVVVVKPWLDSRALLKFAPAATKYA